MFSNLLKCLKVVLVFIRSAEERLMSTLQSL